MHVILRKYVEELADEFEFKEEPSKLFEYFCNYCITSKHFLGRFNPKDITTDEDDASLDGIAFIIDGNLIKTKDDAEEIFQSHKTSLETRLILSQVKSGESFSKEDIGNFNLGIKDFLSLDPKLPNGDFNKESLEIFNTILDNLRSIKNKKPSIEIYYCTSGSYNQEREIKASFEIIEREVEITELFHDYNVFPLGKTELMNLWNYIRESNEAKLKVIEYFGMPPMPNIPQSYITLVNAKEFVDKVLKDSNGNIKNEIFEENIRAFLGENDVNNEIKSTLNNSEQKKLFSVLNNGITIVTPDLTLTPNSKEIDLINYQIINGCQTSHTLFENYDQLDINTNVVLKCIESSGSENISSIIAATNNQTSIPAASFYSLKEKTKLVQKYFEIRNDKAKADAKIYFERRENEFKNQQYQIAKIFDIKLLCRAYNSMFLNEPFDSARYPSKIFDIKSQELFKNTDKEILYYTSALTYYRFVQLVNSKKHNSKKYQMLKWHIIEIFKYIVHQKVESLQPNSNKCTAYCEKIIIVLQNENKEYEKVFKKCFDIIDKLQFPTRDMVKRAKYNNELIKTTKTFFDS